MISTSGHQEIKSWLESKRAYAAGVELYFKYGNDHLLTLLFKEDYSEYKLNKIAEVLEALITAPAPAAIIPPPVVKTNPVVIEQPLIDELKRGMEIITDKQEDIATDQWHIQNDIEDLHDEINKTLLSQEELQKQVDQLKNNPKFIARGWPEKMDNTLQALYDKWKPKFLEKKNLQAQLYEVGQAGRTDPAKKTAAGAMAHKILDLRDEIRKMYEQRDYYKINGKMPEEKKLINIPEDPNTWNRTYENYMRYARDIRKKIENMSVTDKTRAVFDDRVKRLKEYEEAIAELKVKLKIK